MKKLIKASLVMFLVASGGIFFTAKAYLAPKCQGGCCTYVTLSDGSTYACCSASTNGDECSTVRCCNSL